MSDTAEAERKEQRKAKKAWYDQQEHMKERRRIASLQHSKERKVISTTKRFQEHSMHELLLIAQLRCLDMNLNWDTNKTKFTEVLRVLHGPDNV